jgi:hypothetical protein
MKKITIGEKIIAGYTTEDPRSHYGQPVFRCEEMPEIGDRITIWFDDPGCTQEQAEVIWIDSDEAWIMVSNPDSPGSNVLGLCIDAGYWGRPTLDGVPYEDLETLIRDSKTLNESDDYELPSVPEEITRDITEAVATGRVRCEGTINLGDSLGCIF